MLSFSSTPETDLIFSSHFWQITFEDQPASASSSSAFSYGSVPKSITSTSGTTATAEEEEVASQPDTDMFGGESGNVSKKCVLSCVNEK